VEQLGPLPSAISERLVFGWWNTSLSPVGHSRSNDAQREIARTIVRTLVDELQLDFLALGEVSDDDLKYLKNGCRTQSLGVHEGSRKEGRLQFDTGALFNLSRLTLDREEPIVIARGHRNLKLATRIDLSIENGDSFIVFVSHWPGRGTSEETIAARRVLGSRLREKVTEIEQASASCPPVILLGDFNDEPFDESLAEQLLATRDRQLVRSKTGFLYNPFWRLLGESTPHSYSATAKGIGGSYFHRSGQTTRWRTFDQIIFSAAFLGTGNWHLNEEETIILKLDFLIDLIQANDGFFDHLPVISVIERQMKGDRND